MVYFLFFVDWVEFPLDGEEVIVGGKMEKNDDVELVRTASTVSRDQDDARPEASAQHRSCSSSPTASVPSGNACKVVVCAGKAAPPPGK